MVLGDASTSIEQMRSKFDLIVTSPPYYGMRTYVCDQWLRGWFLGGPPGVPYGTASVGQIALQHNRATFTSALAVTWRAVARRSQMGAKLAIRFGAIPSAKTDPEKMILASLCESAAGWVVRDVPGTATGEEEPSGFSVPRGRRCCP